MIKDTYVFFSQFVELHQLVFETGVYMRQAFIILLLRCCPLSVGLESQISKNLQMLHVNLRSSDLLLSCQLVLINMCKGERARQCSCCLKCVCAAGGLSLFLLVKRPVKAQQSFYSTSLTNQKRPKSGRSDGF